MYEKRQLFDFMLERVKETGNEHGLGEPQAFARWFINMYYLNPANLVVADGPRDGKVDAFFITANDRVVNHYVVNSKFTREHNRTAPVAFYDEIIAFWQGFENRDARDAFLEKAVKSELQAHYRILFDRYDEGVAHLVFVTNHRRNDAQYERVRHSPVKVFHVDELVQHLIDDIDIAMPRTPSIILTGIGSVLSPDKRDTGVSTSIVFARLFDFIKYMRDDPYDLLFARNVRLDLGSTSPNKMIKQTFRDNPTEFAFSNNGITMLCEKHIHDPGSRELVMENPRVVNGSQTLHSIRDVPSPNKDARVMLRIIEIPPVTGNDLPVQITRRKDIINKIARRTNEQNPIKKWNLVANDDFQLDLYRFFRRNSLFYERREKEWNRRSRQLRGVGITRGPTLKHLTQLIAAFYWEDTRLGPANAKRRVSDLFDGKTYELIQRTTPELGYQIYLVAEISDYCSNQLGKSKQYIAQFKGHANLVLLALATKALTSAGAAWGKTEFTASLAQTGWEHWEKHGHLWLEMTKSLVDTVHAAYKKEIERFRKREGVQLTLNDFFKTQSYVSKLLSSRLSRAVSSSARRLLNAK